MAAAPASGSLFAVTAVHRARRRLWHVGPPYVGPATDPGGGNRAGSFHPSARHAVEPVGRSATALRDPMLVRLGSGPAPDAQVVAGGAEAGSVGRHQNDAYE